jgi:hypothetical protein
MDDRLDQLGELITPDLLTPAQFADLQHAREQSPERRLMLAVLECAIEDLSAVFDVADPTISTIRRRRYQEAHQWIFGEGGEMVSFALVCEVLEIDAGVLRARLAHTKGEGFKRYRREVGVGSRTHCVLRRRLVAEG